MWHELIASFNFAVSITLPSILLLLFGLFLFRSGQIDGAFCHKASRLMFNWALPALLFFSIMESRIDITAQSKLLLAGAICALVLFIGAEIAAKFLIKNRRDRCIFVQGIYRGNTAIIGVAFCAQAYGAEGLAAGAIFTGVLTLLFNILAVITLNRSLGDDGKNHLAPMIMNIIKNPLIIAIISAFICRIMSFRLPESLTHSGHDLASMALPLALLCIGATFDMKSLLHRSNSALIISILRVTVAPAAAVLIALAFGFRSLSFGVLVLMNVTPVATATYVMVKAMGGNDVMTANIIGITTVLSMLTASLWITVLHSAGLM